MKKRLLNLFACSVCVFLSVLFIPNIMVSAEEPPFVPAYLETPNGTQVYAKIYGEVYSTYDIELYNYIYDSAFPNATRIGNTTSNYNCHSYAWYSQNISSNIYWIPDPSAYYTDYSYEESTGEVGDIICYFDSTDLNLHSGLVVARQSGTPDGVCGDANLVTVLSKWGGAGLYQHQGDYCPYVSTYGGTATYIKYYKLHIHSYTNSPYNTIYHSRSCICGQQVLESHTLRTVKIDDYTHSTNCTKCSYSVVEAHDFRLSGLWYICRTCGARVSALDGPIPQPYGLDPIIS